MDVAFNQHSSHAKRNSRSYTNLNHTSLAPLTSKLPLDEIDSPLIHTSYVEGRSLPSTPSVLSRSNSQARVRRGLPSSALLEHRSKSSTNLLNHRKTPRSGTTTPGGSSLRRIVRDDLQFSQVTTTTDSAREAEIAGSSEWLLRTGSVMASTARESKGQAWLASRASSTSLIRLRDDQEEEGDTGIDEARRAREQKIASRHASRRGSATGAFDADDEFSPITPRGGLTGASDLRFSRVNSAHGSRLHSRIPSRLVTPNVVSTREEYFELNERILTAEPDFVNVEEDDDEEEALAEEQAQARQDEATIQNFSRAGGFGLGTWLDHMFGWDLLPFEEDGVDGEMQSSETGLADAVRQQPSSWQIGLDSSLLPPNDNNITPPATEDTGGWQDAAWLLSVASKVLF